MAISVIITGARAFVGGGSTCVCIRGEHKVQILVTGVGEAPWLSMATGVGARSVFIVNDQGGLYLEHGKRVLFRGTNNVLAVQKKLNSARYNYLRLMNGVLVAVKQNKVAGAAPDEVGRRGGPHSAHQPPGAAHLGP